jgi:hypothetical protein
LATVLGRLDGSPSAQSLADRLTQLVERAAPTPTGDDLAAALRAHQWLLDRAADDGIPLTAAGYLKPVDVQALASVLPVMDDWVFSISREVDARPVHGFRVHVQKAGLLRKHKGTLLLSRAGQAAQADPAALWRHLAQHLVPAKPAFDETAGLLALLHAASSPLQRVDTDAIARTMGQLGWAHAEGKPVTPSDVQWVVNDVWDAIGGVGQNASARHGDRTPSAAAISLVRDALVTEAPLQS